MKQYQHFTPKYWVVHDKTSDDVFLWTASKSYQGAISSWEVKNDFHENENLECILIEVRMMSGDY